ncbi:hypothetical protein PQR75_44985 [Paraburkholderia fungorum]|uniref:hypothetical protein n=1 Tax=Paraburkholderia fungorum TaxID=134537 RepID=UPI0038BC60F7
MSVTVRVEYQYRQSGKKAVQTGSDVLTVSENTNRAIIFLLKQLHPQWEDLKVLSTS